MLGFDAVDIGSRGVGVVPIVVSGLNDALVGVGDGRFAGEFFGQEGKCHGDVAIVEPADESECKHVAAFENRFIVHAAVDQAVLHHAGHGTCADAVGVDPHFSPVVGRFEFSLCKVLFTEGVGVDDDGSTGFCKSVLCLQCGSVHGHQHIAEVAGCENLFGTDVHLESAHAGQRALRGTDVSGIVGEGADAVTDGGRDRGENVSGKLHSVAGITGKADNDLVEILDCHFF